MAQRPRRSRDHGSAQSPASARRLSASPFIPAAVDPAVVAAQTAEAARTGRLHLQTAAPAFSRRLAAVLIDLVMLSLLARVASDLNAALPAAVVGVFGWTIIRFLPLVLLGQTPGQTLAGYEVCGPRGARIGPIRALARDAILFSGVAWIWTSLTTVWLTAPPPLESRNEIDRRWPHDLLTDSWVVRRDAGARAAPTA